MLAVACAMATPRAPARVLVTQEKALAEAFPGAAVQRRDAFLTDQQAKRVEDLARVRLHAGTAEILKVAQKPISLEKPIGNDKDSLTTEVAYRLSLTGPAVTIQTSSSTSQISGWAIAVSVSSRWNAGRRWPKGSASHLCRWWRGRHGNWLR